MDVPDLPPWLELTAEPIADPTAGTVVVPGADARSRADLFGLLAQALDLPEWFGRNWDALADCLLDRDDAGPLALRVDDAEQLLADEPPGQFATLLQVCDDVWSHGRYPFRLVLRTTGERLPALRRRVATART
ncbi:barstar (barnase inhibitor) [Micromonospora palomenae]|uniref:Barstar (Barnase inhibitor) n=1 Tax=Micromonospora palomenae TaxID=1461247 RepID=A0A561WTR9_9ACTN|nr:barstar family protein [Micromonospora palomenae]TWG27250.1 barstar (barnase inhibitor) [Micromonospora palomenae]